MYIYVYAEEAMYKGQEIRKRLVQGEKEAGRERSVEGYGTRVKLK